jgi:cell division septation protein DedD
MATHPYMAIADQAPETPDNGTKYVLTHVAAVRRLMDAKGDAGKKIWFTEFGWSSHGNTGLDLSCGCNNWLRGVSEATQGEYLVRTLKLIQAQFPYVTHAFWYNERNRTQPTNGDWGDLHNANYGLLHNDLTPKPAALFVKSYFASLAPVPLPVAAPTATPTPTPSPTASAAATASPAATPMATPTPTPTTTPTKYRKWRKGAVISTQIGIGVKLVR